MKPSVLIGALVRPNVAALRQFKRLRLGDAVHTFMPSSMPEAIDIARYCRENQIYLLFWDLLPRGTLGTREIVREQELAKHHLAKPNAPSVLDCKSNMDAVIDEAGKYYIGRFVIGEIGGVLYGPGAYPKEWGELRRFASLPPARTVTEARETYVDVVKQHIDYERNRLGKGPLLNGDAGLVFKYHVAAGVDALCLESMPGDPHLMHASIRGAACAFNKRWGTHIAMQCYGGVNLCELWLKRWKTSLFYSYLSGAQFIWGENDLADQYDQENRQVFGPRSAPLKRQRHILREAHQFAHVHTRPSDGPRTRLGVVYGNDDGTPGLWNRVAWGQYKGKKWLEGPAERGWRFVDKFHRMEDWPNENVQGDVDFSGNPPYGQYDIVPIEASVDALGKYACLVFLGWNTMTPEIYRKLKAYVKSGGRLVMYLPHLSTEADRGKPIKLFRDGDFSDLFGVKVLGRVKTDIWGIKCFEDSAVKSYHFPRWRIRTDPRFMGRFTPAKLKVTSGRVISGYCDRYITSLEELQSQPFLIEKTLGKGVAYLVAAWEFPADEGLKPFTTDLLRTVLQGEQGNIRLLSIDRVRYAVYDGRLSGSGRTFSAVYLLNTCPDTEVVARLWKRGKTTKPFIIPANQLQLGYFCGDTLLLPEDKRVDLVDWEYHGRRQDIRLFSVASGTIEVHNLGKSSRTVCINNVRCTLEPGAHQVIRLKRSVDPQRKAFFAKDFLEE